MSRHVFDKLLLTYIGEGWTLKRLRDTCANQWVRSGGSLSTCASCSGFRASRKCCHMLGSCREALMGE